jgi:hypothetical protein
MEWLKVHEVQISMSRKRNMFSRHQYKMFRLKYVKHPAHSKADERLSTPDADLPALPFSFQPILSK